MGKERPSASLGGCESDLVATLCLSVVVPRSSKSNLKIANGSVVRSPFRIRLKTLWDPTDVGFLAQWHPSDVANFS